MKAVSYVINNHDDFKNSLVDIEKAKPMLKERDERWSHLFEQLKAYL